MTLSIEDLNARNRKATDLLRKVRMDMYEHDPRTLARQVGVSVSTVNAFRSGRVLWPRPTTLFGILDAMGYKLVLHKDQF